MRQDLKVAKSVIINAEASKIWHCLTTPEIIKEYLFGTETVTDWKVGNDIRFKTEWEGKVFEQWGKIVEIKTNSLIKYSLFAPRPDLEDKPENYFVMSYVLTDENNQIKLEIIQEDNRPGAVQEEPQGEENPLLKSLKTLAETSH